ncbi:MULTISPECIES: nitroreductase family protein [Limnobaculum]|nr:MULTISPECIES: nitroreductase family protein [Limnobaculum]
MIWTDLGSPVPREQSLSYQPVSWPVGEPFFLTSPPEIVALPVLSDVIEGRRTRRSFGHVSLAQLSQWLWLTGRVMAVGHSNYGFPLTQRPVPSAGAIHPIHIVLSRSDQDGWQLYLPDMHALTPLLIPEQTRSEVRDELLPVIDIQNGIVVRFIAEQGKTSAKYVNADSLIWRDVGALVGQMALVAEALACNFCPMGITGHDWCARLKLEGRLVGTGLAVFGSR